MIKKLLPALLLVFSTAAIANQTMYTCNDVTTRTDGTPTEHPITYVFRHNGQEYPSESCSLTVNGHPEANTQSCVSSVENYPSGMKLQSTWNCVAINANPSEPKFQIIQLINSAE